MEMGAHQRAVFRCLENHMVTIVLPVMSALCCRSSEWFCGRSYPRNTTVQQVQLATLQSALLKEQILGTYLVKISGTSGMGGMRFGSFHQHTLPCEMQEVGQVQCLAVSRAQGFSSRLWSLLEMVATKALPRLGARGLALSCKAPRFAASLLCLVQPPLAYNSKFVQSERL